MLTGIQTLKTFGIFDEYTRPAGMNVGASTDFRLGQ